jgi:quercetin dioxygenase-like cupin family protein
MSVHSSKEFLEIKESGNNHNNPSKFSQKYNLDEIIYTIILNGKESNGKYSLIQITFPYEKEKEVPLHKHSLEDVIIYVIEGSFIIRYGNENIKSIPGMVLKLEKNIEHSYKKIGPDKGKLLVLFTPAGFENYFRDLNSSSPVIKGDLNILGKNDDRIRLHLLEKTYGWTFSI